MHLQSSKARVDRRSGLDETESSLYAVRRLSRQPSYVKKNIAGPRLVALNELPGEELPEPEAGVRMWKMSQSSAADVIIQPDADYLLIVRMSNRSQVRYDLGMGVHHGEIRNGHVLLQTAYTKSSWWFSRPDQTFLLRIPVELFEHAWRNDTDDVWPGMSRMSVFRQDSLVTQMLAQLAAELGRSKRVNRAYTECLMCQICTHLVRRYSDAVDLSIRQSGMPPSRLRKVIEFIAEHLEEDLTLASIAQIAGISPFYFCREFKRSVGVTPHQYVMQQRIETAKVLLQSDVLSITEIGAQLQFPTPSHFAATFKRMVGMTPTAFRPQLYDGESRATMYT
jgi:AraC family transcriptional regulator